MATRSETNVRIGPISLITLVSVIILAVLAVLCLATTRANYTMAERQTEATEQAYILDSVGQIAVAKIDAALQTSTTGTTAAEQVQSDAANLSSAIIDEATQAGIDTSKVATTFEANGSNVNLTVTDEGRTLSALISLHDDHTYTIASWKTTTDWTEEQDTLWGGGA